MSWRYWAGAVLLAGAVSYGAEPAAEAPGVRQLRFVQDDAQDYMVSKVFHLKYVQAIDIAPFVAGMVMRYNMNSSVGTIEYGPDGAQLLTVTCPVEMMPYVDDFIAKVDRNIEIDGKAPGDIIRGTGITRAVYQPHYRSGQALLDVLVNSVIGKGPWSSVYAWDANSNQIYWKDNAPDTAYVFQFLGYLDRPAPQITLNFTLYEIRESTLRDLGIEYLAWKNGPGLNLFQAGFDAFGITSGGTAALQAMSGPVGGFLFAPQFDASFIRMLQQDGRAEAKDSASLTVANSDSAGYEVYFNPQLQNIVKSDNDVTSVVTDDLGLAAGFNQVYLRIDRPIVNIHYGDTQPGYPETEAFSVADYRPGDYARHGGTLCFGYDIQTANVVERNNVGAEVVETNQITSDLSIELAREVVIGQWDRTQQVEQVIGVPWLADIPVLGYLFGTTTTSTETVKVFLTVEAEALDTAHPDGFNVGELLDVRNSAKLSLTDANGIPGGRISEEATKASTTEVVK